MTGVVKACVHGTLEPKQAFALSFEARVGARRVKGVTGMRKRVEEALGESGGVLEASPVEERSVDGVAKVTLPHQRPGVILVFCGPQRVREG